MPEPCDFDDVHAVYRAHKSIDEYVVYLFHLATYDFARKYASGRRVLEFGCGTGYGAHELSSECESIVGVDIEPDAIDFANRTYHAPNLSYRTIGPIERESLPFDDASFDTVLSFQVIEHIDAVDRYLAEIRRVLAPGGVFLCSTPDRRDRLFPKQRPWNVYHVHEYEPEELAALMARDFASVDTYGMTAPANVLQVELDRGHRMRRLAYPLTFPGAPDWWRKPGLKALKKIRAARAKAPVGPAPTYDFDESVIRIEPNVTPSAHILTVATKR
ncbi:MAG TPA: class I SAM-dependent methyltransferase [Acidimicrobiia bacterium]|nr:class I SAM-dependent methyltransferase [Acidimicrobiia bacterium]